MKCMVVVSEKMGSYPIVECGGVVLSPGDKLLVTPEIYKSLRGHYGARVCVAEEIDVPSLKGGHYEYVPGSGKAVKVAADHLPPGVSPEAAPSMAAVSADKSMVGKQKARKK